MPQTKYHGCNSQWRKDQMSQRSSVSGSKHGIRTQRWCPICTGTRILQTGDRRSTSEKQFVPGRTQTTVVISISPSFQQSVHQATLQIDFFFSLNFRGRRRSKKSAVLQLKCMDEVN